MGSRALTRGERAALEGTLSAEMVVALDEWTALTGVPWWKCPGLVTALRAGAYVRLTRRSLAAGRTPMQARLEAARALGISIARNEPAVERTLRLWRNGGGD